jgi:DNA/RNA endonuclease G (NUC1)
MKAALGSISSEVCTFVLSNRAHQRSCRRRKVMNKLEKVALRSAKRTGKPLILVLNNVHLFNNDDGGRDMLLQLQQRAESWAASGEWFYS